MVKLSDAVEEAFARATELYEEAVAVHRRLPFLADLLTLEYTTADRIVWDAEFDSLKKEWDVARRAI